MLRIRKSPTGSGPAPGETRAVGAPEPADLASILARIESRINAIKKALEEAGLEVVETEIPTAPTPTPTNQAPAVHPLDSAEVKQGLSIDADDVAALKAAGFQNLEDISSLNPTSPPQSLTDIYKRGTGQFINDARDLAANL